MDSNIRTIRFDDQGICNYCKLHDELEKEFPLDERGRKELDGIIERIKAEGAGREYDCIVGISGGRDSTYTLYLAKKQWGLRPLAVHFNDGWGNPVSGANMKRVTEQLGVKMLTVSSDWRESKDLKIACLQASVPEMDLGTDIGYTAALYSVAAAKNVKNIVFGHSFRAEGIAPLYWNFQEGNYLKEIHRRFGSHPLRPWKATDAGFNFQMRHIFYYTVIRRIRFIPVLNYLKYNRNELGEFLTKELGWQDTVARYFDDLYHGFMSKVLREKFSIDLRKLSYAALVRTGYMTRQEALDKLKEIQISERPDIINLCIDRLGVTQAQLDEWLSRPVKTFKDYSKVYRWMILLKWPAWLFSRVHLIPGHAYAKFYKA